MKSNDPNYLNPHNMPYSSFIPPAPRPLVNPLPDTVCPICGEEMTYKGHTPSSVISPDEFVNRWECSFCDLLREQTCRVPFGCLPQWYAATTYIFSNGFYADDLRNPDLLKSMFEKEYLKRSADIEAMKAEKSRKPITKERVVEHFNERLAQLNHWIKTRPSSITTQYLTEKKAIEYVLATLFPEALKKAHKIEKYYEKGYPIEAVKWVGNNTHEIATILGYEDHNKPEYELKADDRLSIYSIYGVEYNIPLNWYVVKTSDSDILIMNEEKFKNRYFQ